MNARKALADKISAFKAEIWRSTLIDVNLQVRCISARLRFRGFFFFDIVSSSPITASGSNRPSKSWSSGQIQVATFRDRLTAMKI